MPQLKIYQESCFVSYMSFTVSYWNAGKFSWFITSLWKWQHANTLLHSPSLKSSFICSLCTKWSPTDVKEVEPQTSCYSFGTRNIKSGWNYKKNKNNFLPSQNLNQMSFSFQFLVSIIQVPTQLQIHAEKQHWWSQSPRDLSILKNSDVNPNVVSWDHFGLIHII